mmetsp:Transcript_31392/g.96976  ORF Transcript_31392/g.96976 Transcript_31392/m.96976 type:complete len:374 (+) Transcript_31392:178-1299(+)
MRHRLWWSELQPKNFNSFAWELAHVRVHVGAAAVGLRHEERLELVEVHALHLRWARPRLRHRRPGAHVDEPGAVGVVAEPRLLEQLRRREAPRGLELQGAPKDVKRLLRQRRVGAPLTDQVPDVAAARRVVAELLGPVAQEVRVRDGGHPGDVLHVREPSELDHLLELLEAVRVLRRVHVQEGRAEERLSHDAAEGPDVDRVAVERVLEQDLGGAVRQRHDVERDVLVGRLSCARQAEIGDVHVPRLAVYEHVGQREVPVHDAAVVQRVEPEQQLAHDPADEVLFQGVHLDDLPQVVRHVGHDDVEIALVAAHVHVAQVDHLRHAVEVADDLHLAAHLAQVVLPPAVAHGALRARDVDELLDRHVAVRFGLRG